MTTVTSLTADRMLAIEAASVVDGDVIGGNLILTKHDGSQINAGPVTGPQGPQGPVGSDLAVLTATPVLDVGVINQIRAGRQLTATDFTNMGLSAPLGLWNLSDLSDTSGNGRNLLNKGAVLFGTGINGGANTATQFVGSAAQALYISDTGVADPFRIKTGSWGCWFKTSKRAQQVIFGKWPPSNGQNSWNCQINASNVFVVSGSSDGTIAISSVGLTDVADDRWHFGVGTYDGNLIRCYVDGVLESTAQFNGIMFGGATPLNIGGMGADASTATSLPLTGRVDEVFVTGDILSEDNIRNLYCVKIAHTLTVVPTRLSLNVRRRRRGGGLAVGDFPSQPIRLYNFAAGSLGDEGSNSVALVNNGGSITVPGVDGTVGNALNFNQAQNLSATDAGLPSGLNARSYGCWFKTGLQTTVPPIFGWGSAGSSAAGCVIGMSNGNIYTQNATTPALFATYVADGVWHHAVVVEDNAAIDGIKRKLYVDGKLVAFDTTMVAVVLGGANHFRIGMYPDATGTLFYGQIDTVFVCGYPLTSEQILALYSKSLITLTPSPKNVGDHIEAMNANNILATFDTLDSNAQVDLKVAA